MPGPFTHPVPHNRLVDRATFWLAALSGVSLILMLVLVFVSVITRYLFSMPLMGVNEVVQLASVAVVMLALPYCTAQGAHVSVDVLDHAIGRGGRWFGDVQSRVLSAFVLAVLVWRALLKAMDAHEFGDTTNMLSIPVWPFYAFLAAGMTLCVAIILLQLWVLLTRRSVFE